MSQFVKAAKEAIKDKIVHYHEQQKEGSIEAAEITRQMTENIKVISNQDREAHRNFAAGNIHQLILVLTGLDDKNLSVKVANAYLDDAIYLIMQNMVEHKEMAIQKILSVKPLMRKYYSAGEIAVEVRINLILKLLDETIEFIERSMDGGIEEEYTKYAANVRVGLGPKDD